jgi:hypothetical protein
MKHQKEEIKWEKNRRNGNVRIVGIHLQVNLWGISAPDAA